ncbi:hypothetical protein AJ85_04450 [Alkalihalobacillus alcalophilus ATCC 27647 = CGMCC 1.3604]|uniref:Uncharacterized protein n=1 Tax=Alkalihalobacillus alcalophilus ATCC 27647 = CGMCC 1.3604 TaxID=1218173 RepID=A0A4S4K1Q6_ALKAL|nr:hypothetical protein [Alkalihalobacillus alcalophilus]MED1562794.1 hypothetical protein [Alkalihalobacillus alcalophilus]THG91535.1 hypothetical protein AJ85_04450 [Alkalihalobacillus alcalophilus ATCC 27647 = CGMCC 1.3604]
MVAQKRAKKDRHTNQSKINSKATFPKEDFHSGSFAEIEVAKMSEKNFKEDKSE